MAERTRITKGAVDALVPRSREFLVWDDSMPRFGVRVRPAGSKVYLLRLRVDGRQRWYTIGRHGDPWTPDTARAEAQRVLGQAVNVQKLRETGQAPATLRHPIEAREYGKAAPTLREFGARYLADHARPHKAESSAEADEGNLRRVIYPALGALRVDAITRSEVTRLHLSRKATPTNANRCLALLAHVMTMAEKWGVRQEGTNPCRHVARFPENRRERFLAVAELARLGGALAQLEDAGRVTLYGLAAVRLLVFTGARASEILALTWKAVDLGAGVVRVQSKTGPRSLVLNPPAVAVLAALPRFKRNPFVIVGGRIGAALTLSGLEQVWQTVRTSAQLEDVRLHDLRHSFASVAAASGTSLPIIGALLGHSQPQTTARYAHLGLSPLAATSGAVATAIATAMGVAAPVEHDEKADAR